MMTTPPNPTFPGLAQAIAAEEAQGGPLSPAEKARFAQEWLAWKQRQSDPLTSADRTTFHEGRDAQGRPVMTPESMGNFAKENIKGAAMGAARSLADTAGIVIPDSLGGQAVDEFAEGTSEGGNSFGGLVGRGGMDVAQMEGLAGLARKIPLLLRASKGGVFKQALGAGAENALSGGALTGLQTEDPTAAKDSAMVGGAIGAGVGGAAALARKAGRPLLLNEYRYNPVNKMDSASMDEDIIPAIMGEGSPLFGRSPQEVAPLMRESASRASGPELEGAVMQHGSPIAETDLTLPFTKARERNFSSGYSGLPIDAGKAGKLKGKFNDFVGSVMQHTQLGQAPVSAQAMGTMNGGGNSVPKLLQGKASPAILTNGLDIGAEAAPTSVIPPTPKREAIDALHIARETGRQRDLLLGPQSNDRLAKFSFEKLMDTNVPFRAAEEARRDITTAIKRSGKGEEGRKAIEDAYAKSSRTSRSSEIAEDAAQGKRTQGGKGISGDAYRDLLGGASIAGGLASNNPATMAKLGVFGGASLFPRQAGVGLTRMGTGSLDTILSQLPGYERVPELLRRPLKTPVAGLVPKASVSTRNRKRDEERKKK